MAQLAEVGFDRLSIPAVAVLARAAARTGLRGGVDPLLVLFTIAGAVVHRVFIEQRSETEDFLEQVVDLMLSGVSVEPRKPRR